ncbi:MAG: citrate/2-methylcitrate synthase [Acutalibacteraceae bacterium]|nr:citrate/2-methylcitrate synthase [Acutalibacteraceae bacterium]
MLYKKIDDHIYDLAEKCTNHHIDPELYTKFQVNRGLRDLNGKGVLTGLTEISTMNGMKEIDGKRVPCDGELFYRGYDIKELVKGFKADSRFGFEETTYLLLFGKLPTQSELNDFNELLGRYRTLPKNFIRDVILTSPSKDLMNSLARSVLMLYSYDDNANDTSIPNVLHQCIHLIATMPRLAVYGYQAFRHYILDKSLYIHYPDPNLSTAENILRMLRSNKEYTDLEAKVLDMALVLHAEHGGGNNSTFTTHVVTSSGTDSYSATAASLCSLKGPKHGGANKKVMGMFEVIKQEVKDWNDDEELSACLTKILNKELYDKAGLIYGMGHAVYTKSDPRAVIFEDYVARLSKEKGRTDEYALYSNVARLAPEIIGGKKQLHKAVSPNVDFYSGFVYDMLNLPKELYTPIFAIARISGWSAHRIEELNNSSRIIRPAYMSVQPERKYVPMDER